MFGKDKKPKDSVDATRFNRLQSSGLDIKSAVENRNYTIRARLAETNTHPWAADDRTQLVLGWSSIAYASDRIAEKMAEEVAKNSERVGSITRLPQNVETFVTALTMKSIELNSYAEALYADPSIEDAITENTQSELGLAGHLPTMPEYPLSELDVYDYDASDDSEVVPTRPLNEQDAANYSSSRERPYDKKTSVGLVTVEFVNGLLAAAKELQADAYTLATDLGEIRIDVPELYQSLQTVIQGNYLDLVQNRIDYAETCLLSSTGQISDMHLAEAYDAAFVALERSGQAYAALHCPATFGENWILER